MVRRLLVAPLLSLAAAGALHAQTPAGDLLLGAFELVALNGEPLPVPSPDQPGQTVHSLTLRLTADRFELGSTYDVGGGEVQSAPTLTGPWEVTPEELRFFPEQATPGTTVSFRHAWDGPRLVLTDGKGHRWSMVRADAFVATLRGFHEELRDLVTRAGERVPEGEWGVRAVEGGRTFGELVAHVADANEFLCPPAAGGKLVPETEYVMVGATGKDAVLRVLAESYARCEAAFAQTDAEAMATIGVLFGQPRTRFYAMQMNVTHSYALWGDIRSALRLKGLEPEEQQER